MSASWSPPGGHTSVPKSSRDLRAVLSIEKINVMLRLHLLHFLLLDKKTGTVTLQAVL